MFIGFHCTDPQLFVVFFAFRAFLRVAFRVTHIKSTVIEADGALSFFLYLPINQSILYCALVQLVNWFDAQIGINLETYVLTTVYPSTYNGFLLFGKDEEHFIFPVVNIEPISWYFSRSDKECISYFMIVLGWRDAIFNGFLALVINDSCLVAHSNWFYFWQESVLSWLLYLDAYKILQSKAYLNNQIHQMLIIFLYL